MNLINLYDGIFIYFHRHPVDPVMVRVWAVLAVSAVAAVPVRAAEVAAYGIAAARARNAVLAAAVVADTRHTVVRVDIEDTDSTAYAVAEHRRVLSDVSRRLIQPGCGAQQITLQVMSAYMGQHRQYQVSRK